MAISTSYKDVVKEYNPEHWDTVEEFEAYYLLRISETSQDTNYYKNKQKIERGIKPINHHTELKEYEVWMEGLRATGDSAKAHLVGKAKARNFGQACHIVMCEDKLKFIKEENDDKAFAKWAKHTICTYKDGDVHNNSINLLRPLIQAAKKRISKENLLTKIALLVTYTPDFFRQTTWTVHFTIYNFQSSQTPS